MTARNGERPSSEYSAEEITYARALDWLRVDENGFGYISREGVAAIEVVRKRAPFASNVPSMTGVRCEVTGNPCGSDTWIVGHDCECTTCQVFVASSKKSADDTQPMSAVSSTDVVELSSSDLVPDGVPNKE